MWRIWIQLALSRRSQMNGDHPYVFVAKADRSSRFCVNYRTTINKFLVRETRPMPDIESHIDTVGGASFITVCDVQSAYWQIPIAKKDCHKTAFVTSKGKYVFKVLASRMDLGYSNVPCPLCSPILANRVACWYIWTMSSRVLHRGKPTSDYKRICFTRFK